MNDMVPSPAKKANVLFTCYHFNGFDGAMMHVCEIAEYLSSLGYNCYCASVIVKDDIQKYALSKGLKVVHVKNLPLNIVYDIVWAYHFAILGFLLPRNLKYKKIHVGCLSSFIPDEFLPPYYRECSLASCVSEEAKQVLISKLNYDPNYITVVPNLLPDRFYSYPLPSKNKLNKIAIVSNHPPLELQLLPAHLTKIDIDFYGKNSINYIPITPDILLQYDAIITIGKTVQYALGLGIPVYEYDIFGGCGYINLNNLKREEDYNYSGRRTNRKLTPQEIANELVFQYKNISAQLFELRNISKERYLLSQNIDYFLSNMKEKYINLDKYSDFFRYSENLLNFSK